MFKFLKRLKNIASAELNSALDKAEDPVKMLDEVVRRMEDELSEVQDAVAKQIANRKLLKKKLDEKELVIEKRLGQAKLALSEDREDLARKALEDKQVHESDLAAMKVLYEEALTREAELLKVLDDVKREIADAKKKKENLKARAETARTVSKVNDVVSTIRSGSAKNEFDRLEEKVLMEEAKAEATSELVGKNRSLESELSDLGDDQVELELEQLKKSLADSK